MKKLILAVFVIFSINAGAAYVPQDGDIIFHTSHSTQSKAIQIATKSIFSHVGVIFKKDNKAYVLEAEDKVRLTALKEWTKRGDEKYVVKRLKKPLNETQIHSLKDDIAPKYLGKPYDPYFEWKDNKLYCSELVWLVFNNVPINIQLSEPKELRSFNTENPAVKEKLKERFGEKIPYDGKVVAPADIFDSDQLIEVFKKG